MKKTIVYVALFIAGLSVTACSENKQGKGKGDVTEAEVPVPVKDAFAAKYPGATEVQWEKETEDAKVVYEAEFKFENKEKEAFFEEGGAFIKEKAD